MTKREEIKEGVIALLQLGSSPQSATNNILAYLHSQGVVIKVEEIPDDEVYHGDMPYQMYEDGWRKVEPLV